MRIGLDLDNTIVCYDRVFEALGREAGLTDEVIARGKLGIRNFLRQQGREDEWTVMQGVAYGPRMQDAVPFEGALDFIGAAKARGHEVSVVSHRTKYPYLGEAHDLHTAAWEWLEARRITDHASLFLEEKAEDKAARIAALRCEVFVDDLPEFLSRADMPEGLRKVHFSPGEGAESSGFELARSWRELATLVLAK
jgi:hypothetical protein